MKKKEQLLLLQNTLSLILTVIVLAGTIMPIVFQIFLNRDVSTGAPFFNALFIPLILCTLFMLLYLHYSFILPTQNTINTRINFNQLESKRRKTNSSYVLNLSATGFIILCHIMIYYYYNSPIAGLTSHGDGFSLIESIYFICCILLWCALITPMSPK